MPLTGGLEGSCGSSRNDRTGLRATRPGSPMAFSKIARYSDMWTRMWTTIGTDEFEHVGRLAKLPLAYQPKRLGVQLPTDVLERHRARHWQTLDVFFRES
jgi:hypothetical protein